MRFKIDENLPAELADILNAEGHDTETVYDEGFSGCSDRQLIIICKKEHRVLITLDNDFCNILRYPPEIYEGIIILSLKDQSKDNVINMVKKILPYLYREQKVCGQLWIVEENRIRIRV